GILHVKRHRDGKILKVADLVYDEPKDRDKVVRYLSNIASPSDMDLIIALGMAQEGFDWPYCEHALPVGYRGSLTQIVQIIGRCTRDSPNKAHAQFTNLIAQPDAEDEVVTFSVNNMLKAITASLLMEQVLAPNFKFNRKVSEQQPEPGEIQIKGFKEPSSQRVKDIIESDINDLKASILQDREVEKAIPGNVDPEVINKVMIPKVIQTKYPELNEEEVEELRQHVVADSVIKKAEFKESGDQRFIRMADQFINIEDLHIDLIDRINPFQQAFEILSKSVNTSVLKQIQEAIAATRIQMTEEEAVMLWPKLKVFVQKRGREPKFDSIYPQEHRMAQALIYIREQKRKRM